MKVHNLKKGTKKTEDKRKMRRQRGNRDNRKRETLDISTIVIL